MQVAPFFYKVFVTTGGRQIRRFLGTAFPITPNGGLLTCRHVVDVPIKDNETLAVFDNEENRLMPISDFKVPAQPKFDIAFIPNALQREKSEFFPLLSPRLITMGEDVYSFGYYLSENNLHTGCFKGHIVNCLNSDRTPGSFSISLSYAVIEGLSGSPVLTYHNGPKLVGMCWGNIQTRIVAREVMEFEDEKEKFRETINRIVELGQAHHAEGLIKFLQEIDVDDFIVSSESVKISGL
jgi:hypothetical protein